MYTPAREALARCRSSGMQGTSSKLLPEPAKQQLSLLKEYTEVFAEPKRK